MLPRYVYRIADAFDEANGLNVDEHGYVREDAIKPEAVEHFRAAYGTEMRLLMLMQSSTTSMVYCTQ